MKMRGSGGSTMQKRKAISIGCRIIPLALAVVTLLCSCTDALPEKTEEPMNGGGV